MNKIIILMTLTALETCNCAFSQGFVNLDFEGANLSGYGAGSVPAGDAIPGWTAYLGGNPVSTIGYNESMGEIEISESQIYILGVGSGTAPIQGNYSIFLAGLSSDPHDTEHQIASVGQTGTIPVGTQSLIFWGSFFHLDTVSFAGQKISVVLLGSTADHNICGADISTFAGQTGQLLFSSAFFPTAAGDYIDNIQFSSSPIPEPSASWLVLLGGGILFYARRFYKKH